MMTIKIHLGQTQSSTLSSAVSTRQGMFETNSSSSHALIVGDGAVRTPPTSRKDARSGVMAVAVGEYGWEWRRYYALEGKISYLVTDITGGEVHGSDPQSIAAHLRMEHEEFALLSDVVKEHTGCELQVLPGEGYVDHQSQGNGRELCKDAQKLRRFLFSSDSYLETGNDNSGPPLRLPTDRGEDHYYARYYGVVSPSDLEITVTFVDGAYVSEGFGGVRFQNTRKGLNARDKKGHKFTNGFKKLVECSVVKSVVWLGSGLREDLPWAYHDDITIPILGMLTRQAGGWRFVEDLKTSTRVVPPPSGKRANPYTYEITLAISEADLAAVKASL